jgi:hypothetical protein
MRCKQRFHAFAKELKRKGWQTGRLDPAPRTATACWTYRVPRSGLVQCALCNAPHNAHYNRAQFYDEWFSSLTDQVRFLKHTLQFPCYGDPEYTFSDVERAIQREIVNRNYLAQYELRLAEEQRATDLALLTQLESKYRTPVGERDQELQIAAPPVEQGPVTPVQGSLF